MADSLIGLFGGTFDPIHFGHLNLAVEMQERCQLKEVWFIPAHASPLRESSQIATAQQRLEMVELAIAEIPSFRCLDLEIKRPPPSYTIDTLNQLWSMEPQKKFALLLSDEVFAHFPSWKEAETIKKKIPILIAKRTGGYEGAYPIAGMEISGTTLRQRLKNRRYCGHLIPAKVLDYIYENQLYFIS